MSGKAFFLGCIGLSKTGGENLKPHTSEKEEKEPDKNLILKKCHILYHLSSIIYHLSSILFPLSSFNRY